MSAFRGIGGRVTTPRALALAGLLLFTAAGCSPHVRVVVANESGSHLAGLRIVGVQDSVRVRDLAPGESVTVAARVRGEDELVLRGRCEERALLPAMAAYVEPDYHLRFAVDSAGAVHLAVRVSGY